VSNISKYVISGKYVGLNHAPLNPSNFEFLRAKAATAFSAS